MVRNAQETAASARAQRTNKVGMCLQWCRERALIGARHPDASTAWRNTTDKHFDRKVPEGAFAYWTGGSRGHGHIAIGLGDERGNPSEVVRSTDANGAGVVETRLLSWFDAHWPSLRYVGWAWNVNGVTVPHEEKDWFDMASEADLRKIVAEEVKKNNDEAANRVWAKSMEVTKPDGTKMKKNAGRILRETWSKLSKHIDNQGGTDAKKP